MIKLYFLICLLGSYIWRKDNCASWAYKKYLKYGGYLAFRRTTMIHKGGRRGTHFHVMWSRFGKVWIHYRPHDDTIHNKIWYSKIFKIPPLYFDGTVEIVDLDKDYEEIIRISSNLPS